MDDISPKSQKQSDSSEQDAVSRRSAYCGSELVDGFLISHVSLAIQDLADELCGLRLLQLSDIHYGPATSKRHLDKATQIAASLTPDILLLTGDYLQLSTIGVRHVFAPFKRQGNKYRYSSHRMLVRQHVDTLSKLLSCVTAQYGTYAVLGNHDYSEGARIITSRLGDDIQWLTNSSTVVRIGKSILHLAGIDDLRYGKPDLASTTAQISIAQALQAGPTILMSHNPDIVIDKQLANSSEIDMLICGHTHGGQVRIPGFGAITTQTQQRKHVQGLSKLGETPVYVSNGVGYGGVSLRLNCPPEIVLFELCKE